VKSHQVNQTAALEISVAMLVNPNQNVHLVVEMRDHGFARGTLRKMFQKCRSQIHVLEAAAGLGF
jgi:hypothetical protein